MLFRSRLHPIFFSHSSLLPGMYCAPIPVACHDASLSSADITSPETSDLNNQNTTPDMKTLLIPINTRWSICKPSCHHTNSICLSNWLQTTTAMQSAVGHWFAGARPYLNEFHELQWKWTLVINFTHMYILAVVANRIATRLIKKTWKPSETMEHLICLLPLI